MAHDEELAWEARAGKPAAAAAFLYVVLAAAGGIYLGTALDESPDDLTEQFISWDSHPGTHLVAISIQSAGLALLALVLGYLDRATAARMDRRSVARVLAIGAPLVLAAGQVVQQIELNDLAQGFIPGSEPKAERLIDDVSPAVVGLARGAALALALAFVLVSLNAMRAGLLSRFMGVLGVLLGALNAVVAVVFGAGSALGPVQLFWIAALGLLFLNRWPGGRGPAWQTGEAIPWPGAAEQREEIERRRAEREGLLEPPPDAESEPAAPRPASRKRRKKKR